jgi:hypothetical protein
MYYIYIYTYYIYIYCIVCVCVFVCVCVCIHERTQLNLGRCPVRRENILLCSDRFSQLDHDDASVEDVGSFTRRVDDPREHFCAFDSLQVYPFDDEVFA